MSQDHGHSPGTIRLPSSEESAVRRLSAIFGAGRKSGPDGMTALPGEAASFVALERAVAVLYAGWASFPWEDGAVPVFWREMGGEALAAAATYQGPELAEAASAADVSTGEPARLLEMVGWAVGQAPPSLAKALRLAHALEASKTEALLRLALFSQDPVSRPDLERLAASGSERLERLERFAASRRVPLVPGPVN